MRSSRCYKCKGGRKRGAITTIHLHSVLRAHEDLGNREAAERKQPLKPQFGTRYTMDRRRLWRERDRGSKWRAHHSRRHWSPMVPLTTSLHRNSCRAMQSSDRVGSQIRAVELRSESELQNGFQRGERLDGSHSPTALAKSL